MTSTRDPVDLSPGSADPPVTVIHGSGFELLAQLSASGRRRPPPAVAAAIDELGPDHHELWLHLVGFALRAPTADELVATIGRARPRTVAEHLAGLHVPAWRRYVDRGTILAALDHDPVARRALLAARGYYAGHARVALGRLFERPPKRTRELVLTTLRGWLAEHAPPDPRPLLEAAETAERELRHADLQTVVGYRHTAEPGVRRIVLAPHRAAGDRLLLLQHDDARVVLFPATAVTERAVLVASCRALGDELRLALLRRLATEPATLGELATELGVAKTSLHHHLTLLRSAGLLAVARRPDRNYAFEVQPDGLHRLANSIAALAQPTPAPPATATPTRPRTRR